MQNSQSWEDKIKAKIERLKLAGGGDEKDLVENEIYAGTIEILQSLLEEKE